MKKVWEWIKSNIKIVFSVIISVVLFVVAFSWYRKNKTIRRLELQLSLIRAKHKIDRIIIKYETNVQELNELRKKDKALDTEISKIENELKKKLDSDMTAEEIAQKFREIGVIPK